MPHLPSLQSSLYPSFMGPLGRHAYQCFMRDGGEGTRDWEETYRGRESIEGGLGSAVRPRQQSESIKSVGLLLHWVVINRSWTLSPARRADRVNEGPRAAPHPPPSYLPNSFSPLRSPSSQSPPFLWLVSIEEKQRGKDAVFVGSEEGKDSFLLQWFLTMPEECCIFSWYEHLASASRLL